MPRRSRFEPEGSRSLRGSSSKSYQAPIIVGAMCGRTQASFNGRTCILDKRLQRTFGIGGLASVSVGAKEVATSIFMKFALLCLRLKGACQRSLGTRVDSYICWIRP